MYCVCVCVLHLGGQRCASSSRVSGSLAQKLSSFSTLLTTSPHHNPGQRWRESNTAVKLSRLGVLVVEERDIKHRVSVLVVSSGTNNTAYLAVVQKT